MKILYESLIDGIYYNKVLENYIISEGEEALLNESFQSNLLRNLSKEIYKAEKEHRENDKTIKDEFNKSNDKKSFYYNKRDEYNDMIRTSEIRASALFIFINKT